jgi:hypothetical protein
LFYFVTAVGCFCCPRSRRLDYNITIGSGCQQLFSFFSYLFSFFSYQAITPVSPDKNTALLLP